MKTESNIKPEKKLQIENINKDRCEIVLIDNVQEVVEEDTLKYIYDIYRLNVCYSEDLEKATEGTIEEYIQIAKKQEYEKLASEIRNLRNKLLEQTDSEMCLDRLQLEIPENITTTTLLSGVKKFIEGFSKISKGNMAKYRQQLRDIPQQAGFPYEIEWPEKPINDNDKEVS